jgi:hypothetical protein
VRGRRVGLLANSRSIRSPNAAARGIAREDWSCSRAPCSASEPEFIEKIDTTGFDAVFPVAALASLLATTSTSWSIPPSTRLHRRGKGARELASGVSACIVCARRDGESPITRCAKGPHRPAAAQDGRCELGDRECAGTHLRPARRSSTVVPSSTTPRAERPPAKTKNTNGTPTPQR